MMTCQHAQNDPFAFLDEDLLLQKLFEDDELSQMDARKTKSTKPVYVNIVVDLREVVRKLNSAIHWVVIY